MSAEGLAKISVRSLGKRLGGLDVLTDVDVEVFSGEFVSIVGPSGCGKSTFLRILHGLLPADEGSVLVDGEPVTKPDLRRGFVFQSDGLFPWRNTFKNVGLGLEISRRLDAAARTRVGGLLRLVGLAGFDHYFPKQLSGGMRQRGNLSRALAIDPEILLMDEPFAALDAQTRELMQSELLDIWAKMRKTVVFITHQLDEAVYLSDRVLVMSKRPGRVKEVIPVPLPRPRTLEMKNIPEFRELIAQIWPLIEVQRHTVS